ncbi:MAG: PilZ domain-containing protein [Candidatus Omnitrophota bacterium]|nr:PilZ domain-containing protein [Candidatus Omnitrophota bacterium]
MAVQKERRKFVRLNILTDVAYAKQQKPSEKDKLSIAKNISAGGICLVVYEELRVGDILDLKLCLPEEKALINAVGRVVWIKEFVIDDCSNAKRFDAGIEFIKISDKDMAKINQYVFDHI